MNRHGKTSKAFLSASASSPALVLSAALLLAAASASATVVPMQRVVLTGEALPGLPSGYAVTRFAGASGSFQTGYITNAGTVYSPQLRYRDTATSFDRGFWGMGTPGAFGVVGAELAPALAITPANNFSAGGLQGNDALILRDNGRAAAVARLAAPATSANRFLYYSGATVATMTPFLRAGDPAPGFVDGTVIGDPSGPNATLIRTNDSGLIAFAARLSGEDLVSNSNDCALYAGTPGNWTLIAREGFPIANWAGTVSGSDNSLDSVGSGLHVTNSGQVAFHAKTSDEDVFFMGPVGNIQPVVTETTQAPGFAPGVTLVGLSGSQLRVNDSGRMAFSASTTAPSADGFDAVTGYFADFGSGLQLVAARDGVPPGVPGGELYGSVNDLGASTGFAWSNDNRLAFWNKLAFSDPSSDVAVFVTDSTGAVSFVARERDPALGFAEGYTHGEALGVALNSAGLMVYMTTVNDPAMVSVGRVIYARSSTGAQRLIVKVGDQVEVAPGDLRTIATIDFTKGTLSFQAGRSLNDAGTLVVWMRFTDTSEGLFTVDATVPTSTDLCCRGTTCNPVTAGTCTGIIAGSASLIITSPNTCTGTTLAGCCYADFNHDGTPSIDDLFLYINAYFANSSYANYGGDTTAPPSIDDLFLFINAYFTGCA